MAELLYAELSGQIRDAAYTVYSYFGSGFLEKVYENALAYELRKRGIKCLQQVALKVHYKDNVVCLSPETFSEVSGQAFECHESYPMIKW